MKSNQREVNPQYLQNREEVNRGAKVMRGSDVKRGANTLPKEEIERWETDLSYKKFGPTDLIGNAMNSFFTDKGGITVFIALWDYLSA
jgi:hypothetical protein